MSTGIRTTTAMPITRLFNRLGGTFTAIKVKFSFNSFADITGQNFNSSGAISGNNFNANVVTEV